MLHSHFERLRWLLFRRHGVGRQVPGFHAGPRTYACHASVMGEHVQLLNQAWICRSTIGRYSRVHGRISHSEIGAFCSIAELTVVGGLGRHPIDQLSTHSVFYAAASDLAPQRPFSERERFHGAIAPTRIGNDVWIAYRATVLNGVTIADGAVVATGAVVTKDVPAYAIVAGVPAQVIRYRFADPSLREALVASRWWDWSDAGLREIAAHFSQGQELTLDRWHVLFERARTAMGER